MTAAAAAGAKMDGYRPYSTKVCLCTLFLIEILLDMEKLICTEITAQGIIGHRCCWQSRGLMGVPSRPISGMSLCKSITYTVCEISAYCYFSRPPFISIFVT